MLRRRRLSVQRIKPVILANPTTLHDPLFWADAEGFIFPRVLREMQQAGLLDDPVMSVSRSVPEEARQILSGWEVPCVFSEHAFPQHRLLELVRQGSCQGWLLLTPYNYFLEREAVTAAKKLFEDTGASMVDYAGSSLSRFCICDRSAVEELAGYTDFAVTPFVAPKYLAARLGQAAIQGLDLGPDGAVHKFLLQFLYRGGRAIPLQEYVTSYFSGVTAAERFSTASYARHLADYFSIPRLDQFTRSAARLIQDNETTFLAGQMHLVKRLLPHLPLSREAFLEIGFGPSPVASLLLLNLFRKGYALEPFAPRRENPDLLRIICENITMPDYIDIRKTMEPERVQRLTTFRATIQQCDIPAQSLDFIFSKTVLEHVMDMEETSRKLYDLLRVGGRMYHIVDFSDHVDTSTIRFDFLEHDCRTWAAINDCTNLWRVNDVVELWERIGFRVRVVERLSRVQPVPHLHPCWQDYDPQDLFCYYAAIIAEK
jgi:hypothetical protein